MNKHYSTYLKAVEALGTKFQKNLGSRLKKARDQKRALSICHGEFIGQYHESRRLIREAGYDDGFFKIMSDIHTMDSSMSESDAFVKAHEEYKVGLSAENAKKLALNRALADFIERIKQMEKQAEAQDKPETSAIQKPKRKYWIGRNQTEFIQLMYALIKAERLSSQGKLEMIEDIADFLGVELSEHWNSNLSSSIHRSNGDYEPAILNKLDLKEAWKSYANEIDEKSKERARRKSRNP